MGSLLRQHVTPETPDHGNQQTRQRKVKFADELGPSSYPQIGQESTCTYPQSLTEPYISSKQIRILVPSIPTSQDRINRAAGFSVGHKDPSRGGEDGRDTQDHRRRRPAGLEYDMYRRKERERFWSGNIRI